MVASPEIGVLGVKDAICVSENFYDLCYLYSDYTPLWDVNKAHILEGVRSQMNICAWREMLLGGPNEVYGPTGVDPDAHFLLDGLVHGFKLVDPGSVIHPYICANYMSATVSAKDEISDIIISELTDGKLSLVESAPHCIHALGAVPKKGGTFRPITDASKPAGSSINSYMESTFQTFKFKTIDTVSAAMSEGCFMAVTDITSAYRSILIRAGDRKFQGLQWEIDGESRYIQDNFLAFGTRMSPSVFNRVTDAVARYVTESGYFCVNYLDDFLVMGDSFKQCQEAQLYLHGILRRLGFYLSYKKIRSPSQVQLYLGVEVDSLCMKLRLPEDKVAKLHEEVVFFKGRLRATKKQLQHLCGVLGHCSTLVRGGRTFSHRVIEMLTRFTPSKRYITLSKSFRKDMEWWEDFAACFNGEARIINRDAATAMLHTDAASTIGWGAVFNQDWAGGSWTKDWSDARDKHEHLRPIPAIHIPININVQELYPILESLWRWGEEWRDCRVECVTDNTQVVAAINTGKSVNVRSMDIMRLIFWETVKFNCHLVGVFLPGVKNILADAVSRAESFDAIPDTLCCRGKCIRQGVGSPCRRTEIDGMVGVDMEDQDLPVEALPQFLQTGGRDAGPYQTGCDVPLRGTSLKVSKVLHYSKLYQCCDQPQQLLWP